MNDKELFSGFLEKPAVPPSFVQEFFKLAFVGKSGVGKTSLINLLANHPVQNSTPGETPGIELFQKWNYLIRYMIFLMSRCESKYCILACQNKESNTPVSLGPMGLW